MPCYFLLSKLTHSLVGMALNDGTRDEPEAWVNVKAATSECHEIVMFR